MIGSNMQIHLAPITTKNICHLRRIRTLISVMLVCRDLKPSCISDNAILVCSFDDTLVNILTTSRINSLQRDHWTLSGLPL